MSSIIITIFHVLLLVSQDAGRLLSQMTRQPLLLTTRRTIFTHLQQPTTSRITAYWNSLPGYNSLCSVALNQLLRKPEKQVASSQPSRSVTLVSRLGKRKSVKSVTKRFRRVKGGFLKRWRSGKTHLMRKKSSRRRWRLRGSVLVKSKTHLKVLNKMMYKH